MPCHVLLALPVVIAVLFLVLPWTTALPVAVVLTVGTVAIAYSAVRATSAPW